MAKMPPVVTRIVGIVVVLAIVVGGAYYLFFRGSSNKTVKAQFSYGVGVYTGTPVRILGVNVGEVTGVKPHGKFVTISMEYDSKYKLAPEPTVGAVEVANSLVSDRYIQLTPLYSAKRDHGKWLPSGAMIKNNHTSAPAELDDIYAALDKLSVALGPTGANKPSAPGKNDGALSTLLNVAAANLKGNGTAIGNSIAKLSQAAHTLATKRGDLFGTVQNLQKFSKALADSDGDIRNFNELLAQVSGDLAGERADLGAALKQLGLALDDVNSFVKNNAGKFHGALQGLEDVTGILVHEKASLNETLAVGPVALANIVHAYQPNLGVIVSRGNLASFTDFNGKTVCAVLEIVIQKAGGVVSGILGKITGSLNSVCNGILGGGGPGAIKKAIKKILSGIPGLNLGGILGLVPQFRNARRLTTGKIGAMVNTALGGGGVVMRARIAALLSAAALVLSGCGFSGLYGVSLPGGADTGDHPISLTAYFADVLDLVPQSAVKFHDVAVGKVTDISLAECPNVSRPTHKVWCAEVKMQVRGSVHLLSDARAEIKQTSLLGEKYVSLQEPSTDCPNAPTTGCPAKSSNAPKTRLVSGDTIKYVDTSSAPEVEEVLGALSLLLNNGGLNQIRTIAHEMNSALHGNESTIRDLLGQLNTFVGTLDAQKQDIINALTSVDTLAKTLNQQKQVLVDALDTYPAALRVLSAERGKLTTLLTSLSNLGGVATRVINATQQGLVDSLKALAPSIEALVSAGDSFPKALKILGTFPFPLGTTRTLVKGDYANLYAYVNLDLGTILCQGGQIPKALCNLLPQSNDSGKTAGKTSSQQATRLPPQLIGAGR